MSTLSTERRCAESIWKGPTDSKMAAKARCKYVLGHGGWHKDENDNRFAGTGADTEVVVVR